MSTGNLKLYSVILKGNSDPIFLWSLIDAARQVLTLDQDEIIFCSKCSYLDKRERCSGNSLSQWL